MNRLALLMIALSMTAEIGRAETPLSFDDVLALAEKNSATATASNLDAELEHLRTTRLPSLRLELAASSTRTSDVFYETPFELRAASSALALEYPLWDGGVDSSRLDTVEAKLQRRPVPGQLDDAQFAQLLDAFGELHLAQRQVAVVRPLYEELSAEAGRSALRLESGEISNLTDVERRELALSVGSRLLELEARRVDAMTRLRLITGIDEEPAVVIDPVELAGDEAGVEALHDDFVELTASSVAENRARLRGAMAASGLRVTLSGYAGVAAAESEFRGIDSDGSFGIYGLRLLLSYPLLRGRSSDISILEARTDLELSLRQQEAAVERARARVSEYRLREESARKRIALLRESVAAAVERSSSVSRLVDAGLRSESELAQANAERTRRELDLLAAEIERWKVSRLLARMTAPPRAKAGQP